MQKSPEKITLASLRRYKKNGEKIVCLTAYDSAFACLVDQAGVDVILVGDSLGMVVQGHDTTVPVKMKDMLYHCQCVSRGVSRPLIMADMPFMSYITLEESLRNAACLVQEGGAHIVKLESGEHQSEVIHELSAYGIASCAHLGLRPQWIHKLGDYSMQARTVADAEHLFGQAETLVESGADMLLLECVPQELATRIAANLDVPVIGIGAGPGCDGQILVTHDILGMSGYSPKFAQNFLTGRDSIKAALEAYTQAVRQGNFPK